MQRHTSLRYPGLILISHWRLAMRSFFFRKRPSVRLPTMRGTARPFRRCVWGRKRNRWKPIDHSLLQPVRRRQIRSQSRLLRGLRNSVCHARSAVGRSSAACLLRTLGHRIRRPQWGSILPAWKVDSRPCHRVVGAVDRCPVFGRHPCAHGILRVREGALHGVGGGGSVRRVP